MTERYVVIGNPISHSLSPSIHLDFAHQTGVDVQYRRWLSPLNGFDGTVSALIAAGVRGANVTVPFKEQAARIAQTQSEGVSFAGAANTLKLSKSGQIEAHNTDGEGLCQDLKRLLSDQDLSLSAVHVLLIGAGGAARGCVSALKEYGVPKLTILNRTPEKAKDLARLAQAKGLEADGQSLTAIPSDIALPLVIVNASSSSLHGGNLKIDPSWWSFAVLCLDMMYSKKPTPFMELAMQHKAGIAVADGLGMLVNQAALAFEIWTGRRPDALSTLVRMRQTLDLKI